MTSTEPPLITSMLTPSLPTPKPTSSAMTATSKAQAATSSSSNIDDLIVPRLLALPTGMSEDSTVYVSSPMGDGGKSVSMKSSKRSSSSSNDLLYERDRFKARLQTFNKHNCNDIDKMCEVCEDIGTKTTKLNIINSHPIEDDIDEDMSPLDSKSKFYQKLSLASNEELPIKILDSSQIDPIFDWYFNKKLPPTSIMFPWLHGLHEDNFAQKLFFLYQQQVQKSKGHDESMNFRPQNIRFLMCIKTSKKMEESLKNSINVDEILTRIQTSKQEVIHSVTDIINSIFDGENQHLIDLITKDCFKLGFVPTFLNLDPEKGVSLRNFHIQVAKLALCSDFIIYGLDESKKKSLARLLYIAQRNYDSSNPTNVFILDNLSKISKKSLVTKIDDNLLNLEINKKTQLNLINSNLNSNDVLSWDNDYQFKEKIETTKMSSATKISFNVWVGNIWDFQIKSYYQNENKQIDPVDLSDLYFDPKNSIISKNDSSKPFDILSILPPPKSNWKLSIHCHKDAHFPSSTKLSQLIFNHDSLNSATNIEFPPSGSVGLGDCKKDNLMLIVNTCKLLYLVSSSCLIYCSDGYTESSLLVLCYIIYLKYVSLDEAMLKLHLEYGRPFYIFNSDVGILKKLEIILKRLSPSNPAFKKHTNWSRNMENLTNVEINELLLTPTNSGSSTESNTNKYKLGYIANDSDDFDSDSSYDSSSEDEDLSIPTYLSNDWVKDVEGSLPSRILPYLYLGSLKHANSLTLLQKLGISKVISVGECLDWLHDYKFQQNHDIIIDEIDNGNIEIYNIQPNLKKMKTSSKISPIDTVVKINNLQDDGIDELTHTLPNILNYINDVYKDSKILVHCRVGVSRSATVCIAEVMKRFNISLPKAYLYVRVRRLNIVIQPNLRFMYELFKWEEQEKLKEKEKKSKLLREIDWFVMCREITRLNIPYLSS